jgi:hypothetical protein
MPKSKPARWRRPYKQDLTTNHFHSSLFNLNQVVEMLETISLSSKIIPSTLSSCKSSLILVPKDESVSFAS